MQAQPYNNIILRTSIAAVSSAWPSSKALQAKRHETENKCPEESRIVIKRSGSQLTKEDMLGQRGPFWDFAENKSGIQKSEHIRKVCSREKVYKRWKVVTEMFIKIIGVL